MRTALHIICDTREQAIPPFPDGVVIERATLQTADYTTPLLRELACIERKSVSDFGSTITWGRDRFDCEVERLRPFRWKCVIVEGDLSQVYRECPGVHPHAVLGSIASFYARADVPTLFASSPAGAGRLIAGLLRRWEERAAEEGSPA